MMAELIRFAVVGLTGFFTDAGLMSLIAACYGVSPLVARFASFPAAVFVTWMLNRFWTFEHGRARAKGAQGRRYFLVQLLGFAINYLCFVLLVTASQWWNAHPVAAVAVGSMLSMVVTYFISRRYVFSAVRTELA